MSDSKSADGISGRAPDPAAAGGALPATRPEAADQAPTLVRTGDPARAEEIAATQIRPGGASDEGDLDATRAAPVRALRPGTGPSGADGGGDALVGTEVGHYRLLRQLGRGGMGVVYLAEDPVLGRKVAIKFILDAALAGPEQRDRLVREAQAGAKLQHPGIVPVYEIGRHGENPFLAMAFVEGRSLAEVLGEAAGADRPPMRAREAVALVRDAARAVHHAHESGVIHRDLKPANLMIDAAGRPHVLDFGLARVLDDAERRRLTGSADLLGTPEYMSPEQASAGGARGADRRADVFALGAILYHSCTGLSPFRAETVMGTLAAVLTRDPEPPSRVRARLWGQRGRGDAGLDERDLDTVVLRALDKDPERRFGTAAELADELERILGGEPIRSRPVGSTVRWMRRARREPRLAAAVAVAALLLPAAVAFAWIARERAAETRAAEALAARERAEAERKEREREAERRRIAEAEPHLERARAALLYLHDHGDRLAPAEYEKKSAEGEAAAREAARVAPELAEGHVLLGRLLGDRGDLDGAEAALVRGLEREPESVTALLWLADALLSKVVAEEEAGRAGSPTASAWRARILEIARNPRLAYARPGDAALARALAGRATALSPDVLPDIEAVLAEDPRRFWALQIAAQIHLAAGRKVEALSFAERATGATPQRAAGWLLRTQLLRDLGRLDEAEAVATEGLARLAGEGRLCILRASLRQQAGRVAEAIADLDVAVQRAPDFAQARVYRAKLRRATGDVKGALEDLDHVLAAAPDDPDARMTRADIRLRLREPARAIEDLERLPEPVRLGPNAALLLASARWNLGDPEAAVAVLDAAVARLPQSAVLALQRDLMRAKWRLAQGDLEAACADLRSLLEADPQGDFGNQARELLRQVEEGK